LKDNKTRSRRMRLLRPRGCCDPAGLADVVIRAACRAH
jgi:hypothetical protein